MSATRSDASLRGKVRHLANEHNLKPQEVLQMYLFERLLMRLARSSYADKFVLKGGFLVSSMTGIYQRTTMDMDATVVGMDMDEGSATKALADICAVDVGDDMTFDFERIEPIREDDEYVNWRAHLRAKYGRIDAPVKVDITTGDVMYPSQVRHKFELMFDQGTLDVLSYHPATVLAEKLETVLRRGEANTRGRDFYDLYVIPSAAPKLSARLISKERCCALARNAVRGWRLRTGLQLSRLFARRASCIACGIRTSRTTYMREGLRSRIRLNPSKS